MTGPLSADGPRRLLLELRRLVAERTPADVEIPSGFAARNEAIRKEYQEAWERIAEGHEKEKAAAEQEYDAARRRIVAEYDSEHATTKQEYQEVRDKTLRRFEAAKRAEKDKLEEARWEATTVFEATKDAPGRQLKAVEAQVAARWEELQAIGQDAEHVLRRRRQWRDYPEPEPVDLPPESDPTERFAELASRAADGWRSLSGQGVGRLFEGTRPIGLFLLLWMVAAGPSLLALGWNTWYWIPVSAVGGLGLWAAVSTWLYRIAKMQSAQGYQALRRTIAQADVARRRVLEAAKANCQRQDEAIRQRLADALKKAHDDYSKARAELGRQKKRDLEQADQKYPPLLAEITARRDRQLQAARDERVRQLGDIEERYRREADSLLAEYSERMAASHQRFDQEWAVMADRWRTGIREFQTAVRQMNLASSRLFPDWNSPDWQNWVPAAEIPSAIPFGQFHVDLRRIDGAVPEDGRLQPPETDFSMPALLPFRDRSLMLLKAGGDGRAKAVKLIQAVMLRLLTSMPPGKVRFTIIDPVGLGENFSAFMHLADYDEQLVSARIWTESSHIEQRLADLTEHMETVIQVYLRNEFRSIQEYNEFAGEMAEPYRVLVVANFPANFSEAAARRLASIVASGARCGVYTLLSVDTKLRLPRDFHLADLRPQAVSLSWSDGRFVWEHPDFGKLPLSLSCPPPAEQFTDIVRSVGRRLKDADRIEVPFECVAPADDKWWTSDTRTQIDVPLGRAGAMKLQHLRLGKGTSQHVLISGRTGSGKSTLLHALITNVALHYSPDEIELYLVDFKKGVEFKGYARYELPHARVIAIESEREFGLSVLESLDAELRRRGDLFRKLSVQDLQAFRAARRDAKLPRILLVIDEFQELFVEEDRIAQTAALLLDRLVRQGRAFGIHVLLGSQTLAGAYSLPRSTIGQMAVRIALQCSEADAHLILSEENTAARLLTRPGEAIYNDANGLYEGNHPFQVVWLPDHQREAYLQQIRQFARKRNCTTKPPIVFEGNVPADPSENRALQQLLAADTWPGTSRVARAWLGSAVAIKPPTVAQFVRQSGSNLLMVGHREEAALGVLATCLISLAAQHPPSGADPGAPGATFYIFDGTRPDAPEVGFWKRLASVVPQGVKLIRPRDTASLIAEVAEEVSRREEAEQEDAPPVYLIIYNLSRFRDLRKAEDDFGFSGLGEDKPPSPAKQFGDVLREGPPLGVHTLLWCDSYSNVMRWLDRQSLRDLEMRVLFQMNASDSSNLIDSAAAGRLGVHRAVLYNEDEGRLEKFRPYGLPSDDWLAWVKKQLHGRAAGDPVSSPDQA